MLCAGPSMRTCRKQRATSTTTPTAPVSCRLSWTCWPGSTPSHASTSCLTAGRGESLHLHHACRLVVWWDVSHYTIALSCGVISPAPEIGYLNKHHVVWREVSPYTIIMICVAKGESWHWHFKKSSFQQHLCREASCWMVWCIYLTSESISTSTNGDYSNTCFSAQLEPHDRHRPDRGRLCHGPGL